MRLVLLHRRAHDTVRWPGSRVVCGGPPGCTGCAVRPGQRKLPDSSTGLPRARRHAPCPPPCASPSSAPASSASPQPWNWPRTATRSTSSSVRPAWPAARVSPTPVSSPRATYALGRPGHALQGAGRAALAALGRALRRALARGAALAVALPARLPGRHLRQPPRHAPCAGSLQPRAAGRPGGDAAPGLRARRRLPGAAAHEARAPGGAPGLLSCPAWA
jgi:hypothetical protein